MSSISEQQDTCGRFFKCAAIAALIWVVAARVSSPSDLWAYTQYKTMSYTTDIIVNGGMHWILPVYCEAQPATKPPLYNWLAVPFVHLLGFNSEIGHKFPSIIAFCACWAAMVRLGRKVDTHSSQSLGWLTGLILAANYVFFKLGYVARPDMLLTLWLTLAWLFSTQVMISAFIRTDAEPLPTSWLAAGFWVCITLAAYTKGPAAGIGVFYALIAARVIGGRWKNIVLLHPIKGMILTLLIVGAWLFAVWKISPDHLQYGLWQDELLERITGTGDVEAQTDGGLKRWLLTLPYHPMYFLSRFAPWSLIVIAAMWVLWRGKKSHSELSEYDQTPNQLQRRWLCAAVVQIVVVIAVFTLSTGKRADYLAATIPPGALLAAWWLLKPAPQTVIKRPWFIAITASLTLGTITVLGMLQPASLSREYGRDVKRFVDDAHTVMSAEPLPRAFWVGKEIYIQALVGSSTLDGRASLESQLKQGVPCWIMVLRRNPQADLRPWIERQAKPIAMQAELVLQSTDLPTQGLDLAKYYLYRVTPAEPTGQPPSSSITP